jgi:Arc/MetJ-type ribon-helix-helix transcriptional regulator
VVQKIAVTLDKRTVADVDRLVSEGKYPNRSRALQAAADLLAEREAQPSGTRIAVGSHRRAANGRRGLGDDQAGI